MRKSLIDHQALGSVVIERFSQAAAPGELAESLDAFKAAYRAFGDAASAADQARRVRDAAREAIGESAARLKTSVVGLAAKMTGAEIGTRLNPFSGLVSHSPSRLIGLAYASQVAAVRELAERLALKSPPEEVTRKIAECLQRAAEVERAIAGLVVPQADFLRRRGERDAAVEAMSRAYSRLRLRAQLAFEGDPEAFKVLFAAPERVQRPANRRKRRETPEQSEPERQEEPLS